MYAVELITLNDENFSNTDLSHFELHSNSY